MGRYSGYLFFILFLAAFCYIPLYHVMKYAFIGEWGPGYIVDGLLSRRSAGIIWFTIYQSAISSILTVLIALPGAFILSRYRFRGLSMFMSMSMVPFVIPPMVLSIAFLSFFGSRGYLNGLLGSLSGGRFDLEILYTPVGIVLAHIILNYPVALRILHARASTLDGRLEMASILMGAKKARTFFRVVLPQMKYSLIAASSLVFTFCFLSFGVILVIGGMTNATIEVEIYRQFSGAFDRGLAGSLLIVQTAILLFTTWLYLYSSSREAHIKAGEPLLSRRGFLGVSLSVSYTMIAAILLLGPLLAVVVGSFKLGGGLFNGSTFGNYMTVLSREADPTIGTSGLGAILNSLIFAFLSVLISVPLSISSAFLLDSRSFRGKSLLDVMILFPIGASAVALGYGLSRGWPSSLMSGTWIIIVAVHVLLAYPFCTRAVTASKREMSQEMMRAAELMGASKWRIFGNIWLPVLLPGIMVASVFAFAISLGEFGATYMVYSPEYTTMPVALYRFVAGGRDMGALTAYSVIMIFVIAASMLSLDLIFRRLKRWV
ncbi:MAG: iron ABC transporter permease [Candidatus Thermoplasmatota archaeon]|nr:iron ABC transporter permease [Candidatus Thermoplasmatota archaeon]